MIPETECAVVLVGNRGDTFHVTLSDGQGNMQAWSLSLDRFDALMVQCHEASRHYRVERLRAAAAARLAAEKSVVMEGVDYADTPDLG